MAIPANKRSVMTLYSGSSDPYSHRVRLILAEKGVSVDVIEVNLEEPPEELLHLNPYGSLPTIIDRDLVLYEPNIIAEYLDERFPHPPLLPVYPVARAKSRQMMYRVERDWYLLIKRIEMGGEKEIKAARKELQDSLVSLAPLFAGKPYFLSDELTLVDCYVVPLLWRLPQYGVELPTSAKAIQNYAERLFKRPTFKASLTESEMEINHHS
jgi:RNA polymerase-associated protein